MTAGTSNAFRDWGRSGGAINNLVDRLRGWFSISQGTWPISGSRSNAPAGTTMTASAASVVQQAGGWIAFLGFALVAGSLLYRGIMKVVGLDPEAIREPGYRR